MCCISRSLIVVLLKLSHPLLVIIILISAHHLSIFGWKVLYISYTNLRTLRSHMTLNNSADFSFLKSFLRRVRLSKIFLPYNLHRIIGVIRKLTAQVRNIFDALYLWKNIGWKLRRSPRIFNSLFFNISNPCNQFCSI